MHHMPQVLSKAESADAAHQSTYWRKALQGNKHFIHFYVIKEKLLVKMKRIKDYFMNIFAVYRLQQSVHAKEFAADPHVATQWHSAAHVQPLQRQVQSERFRNLQLYLSVSACTRQKKLFRVQLWNIEYCAFHSIFLSILYLRNFAFSLFFYFLLFTII